MACHNVKVSVIEEPPKLVDPVKAYFYFLWRLWRTEHLW